MTELTNERAGRVMMSAHALAPHSLSHPEKMRWMAKYFLANYRATPSSECALPPLPEPDHSLDGGTLHFYTAEQVEQIRRDAIAADRRARSNSPEFDGIKTQPASAAQGVKTWAQRQADDERAGRPRLNRDVYMFGEIADLRSQLARQSHGEPLCTMRSAFDAIDFMAEHNGPGRAHWALGKLKRVEFAAPPLSSEPQEHA